jgi:hypothetical protein
MRVTATLALALAACATSRYTPRSTPWVSQVLVDGVVKYQVEGRTFDTLADATATDPESQRELSEAQDDFVYGGLIALAGSTVLSLGLTDVLLVETTGASLFGGSSAAVSWAIAGVGLAGMVGGLVLVTSGERDRLDAFNRFNDRMFERWLEERSRRPTPEP